MRSLITNKKGWITRDFVLAGLLFTGVMALFVLFIGGFVSEYNRPDLISDSFNANYNKLNDITDNIETMRSATSAGEGLTFRGTFDVVFASTFTVIQLVFSTLALVGTLPAQLIVDFTFIDSLVVATLLTIGLAVLTAGIVFVWVSSISRSKI